MKEDEKPVGYKHTLDIECNCRTRFKVLATDKEFDCPSCGSHFTRSSARERTGSKEETETTLDKDYFIFKEGTFCCEVCNRFGTDYCKKCFHKESMTYVDSEEGLTSNPGSRAKTEKEEK